MYGQGQGMYGNLYLPLNIVINLQLLFKNCLNKRKSNLGPYRENVMTIIKPLLNHLSYNTELQLCERVSTGHIVRKNFQTEEIAIISANKQGSSDYQIFIMAHPWLPSADGKGHSEFIYPPIVHFLPSLLNLSQRFRQLLLQRFQAVTTLVNST